MGGPHKSIVSILDKDLARQFLLSIWNYTSLDARVYEFVIIGKNVRAKQFVNENGLDDVIQRGLRWLTKNVNPGDHVYIGVLPRAKESESGRGKAKDVKIGKWLWADLDYKEEVDQAEFNGCREYEDYRLECYYRSGNKIIHVNRPPLKNILDTLSKIDLTPSLVVDSGAGYHLYFELEEEIHAKDLEKLENSLVDKLRENGLPVDIQAKDLARILRLVGSLNPRVNRKVEVIYTSPTKYRVETLLDILEKTNKQYNIEYDITKGLSEKQILEIVNLIKPAYKPGQRDYIILYLTGWLKKAHVDYNTARRVVELLAEDDEELEHRIYVLDRTYGLRGNPPSEKELRGKTGLQEILEETLGEQQALEIIRRIEEILGVSSPFRDSIFEILDYEKQLYAIANLHRLVVVRGRRDGTRIQYKERITIGAPTRVVVYINPLGGLTKYQVTWETKTRGRPLSIGPAPIEDIIDRLKAEGLILNRRLAYDVITAIIEGYIRKERAEIREEIEAPGFYWVDNKILPVRVEIEEPNINELREALKLLDELATKWFNHVVDRFSLVVKWGIIAPFIYAYKQRGKWVPWLYLYGSSYTGKTTLGEIVLNIWDLDAKHRKTGASIDTPARIGYVLSSSTFPILVNEPGNAIYREDIIEILKNAIESTITRGKYIRGSYTEIPSLAPLLITSNKALPRDDALVRRLLILRFTYGERVEKEKAHEFDTQVKPKIKKLKIIGKWIAKYLIDHPKILEKEWKDIAKNLLEIMFKEAGLEPPKWIYEEPEAEDDIYEDIREAIRNYLIKRINEEYTRFVGRVIVEKPEEERTEFLRREEVRFVDRVIIVLQNRLIPWAILKEYENNKYVIFTTGFTREIKSIIGDIGGLKSIAELLGWEYKLVKIGKKPSRVAIINIESLIDFLNP